MLDRLCSSDRTVVPDTGSAARPCRVEIVPPLPELASVLEDLAAALARAEAAGMAAEAYRREAVLERSAGRSMAYQFGRCQDKLAAALAREAELRRLAREPLAQQEEIARLNGILSGIGVDVRKRSTITSLRLENARLREKFTAQSKELAALRRAHEKERVAQNKAFTALQAETATLQMEKAELQQQVRILTTNDDDGTVAARIKALLAKIKTLRAIQSNSDKQRFGRKSEKQETPPSDRNRGQQPGSTGHGRTPRDLERKEEIHEPEAEAVCSCCGKPYAPNGAHESEIIEVEVKAHTRVIRRPRYRASCDCPDRPSEIAAPPVPRLFPHTAFGISVWSLLLLEKYHSHRPFNQFARWLGLHGLPISAGTLCDRIRDFTVLFGPLSREILAHQNQAAIQQGDETRWRVQEQKGSQRAWLWLAISPDAATFHIDPSRSVEAAMVLFGSAKEGTIVVCDRFSTYKALARQCHLILAFCWAHTRRDFVECGGAAVDPWKQYWLDLIAGLFKANDSRLAVYDPARDLEHQSTAFNAAQTHLTETCDALFKKAEQDLASRLKEVKQTPADDQITHAEQDHEENLNDLLKTTEDGLDGLLKTIEQDPDGAEKADPKVKPLRSLLNHRDGLTVFLNNPGVPMDNNRTERTFRGAAISRKLCFGSDSLLGAQLTAMLYSIFVTLQFNDLDIRMWLTEWLETCAVNHGKPPSDLAKWLPWSMDPKRRRSLTIVRAQPPPE